jgi:predicted anti-sigma-YlaC factor YlaD
VTAERRALEDAGIPPDQAEAITAEYAEAQLLSLKIALLAASAIALACLFLTRGLPRERLGRQREPSTTTPAPHDHDPLGPAAGVTPA